MAWRILRIEEWSNDDLLCWVKSIGLSDKWEDTVTKAIKAKGCSGRDCNSVKSGKGLADLLDIRQPMLATRVYREFKTEKNKPVRSKISKSEKKTDEHEVKEFPLQMFGQSKYWRIPQKVTQNTTIRRVKELYKATSDISNNCDGFYLIAKAKILGKNNYTLGQYGITDERHLITVKFRMHFTETQTYNAENFVDELLNKLKRTEQKLTQKNGELLELRKNNCDLNEECKGLKLELQDIKSKYNKCIRQHSDYTTWDCETVADWIIGLDANYIKYQVVLRKKLKEEEISGADLIDLDKNDLDRFGIKLFKHKKRIIQEIQKLTLQNNDNIIPSYNNEGKRQTLQI